MTEKLAAKVQIQRANGTSEWLDATAELDGDAVNFKYEGSIVLYPGDQVIHHVSFNGADVAFHTPRPIAGQIDIGSEIGCLVVDNDG